MLPGPLQSFHFSPSLRGAAICTLLVALCSLLGSCVYQDHAEQVYLSFPAKTPAQIKVFSEPPPGKYDLVADIQANGAPESFFKKRAALLGGDAIIFKRVGGLVPSNAVSPSEAGINSFYTRATASVIKFK